MVGAGEKLTWISFLQPVARGWSGRAHVDSRTTSSAGSVAVMTTPVLKMFHQGGCEDPSGERPVLAHARQRRAGAPRNVRVRRT